MKSTERLELGTCKGFNSRGCNNGLTDEEKASDSGVDLFTGNLTTLVREIFYCSCGLCSHVYFSLYIQIWEALSTYLRKLVYNY